MHVLRNVLEHTQKNSVAIGHFNIADLVLLKAVFASAQELKVPVLVGAFRGRARVYRSPSDCSSRAKFAGGTGGNCLTEIFIVGSRSAVQGKRNPCRTLDLSDSRNI